MAQFYEGIGRRKQSTARVRLTSGSGKFLINEKPLDVYFGRLGDMDSILSPFNAVDQDNSGFDVTVKVSGGGVNGQAESVRLGLARAFVKMNEDYLSSLRKAGLLTRDARVKERKKPGLKRARKAPTYTKR
ncbi:MAG: 30S ribosomal protein S9 [Anaerolineaceae bacterium]|jgi:small subunit ribosomal protein S9|nr:30S ribosomal protein S9 [Anaerolineaceae bacterium]PKO06947.1 MAG: 30S ribosomal protein S9 [Chloroflexi bacterium HGW-Chloroflexi-3]